MRKEISVEKWLAVAAVTLLLVTGCSLFARKVKLAEEFTLRPGAKVVVSGTGLTIQLKEVGHQWYVDRRADSPYAQLTITNGGQSMRSVSFGDGTTVGDYTIKMVAANPFRDNGGPDCKLIVTRH